MQLTVDFAHEGALIKLAYANARQDGFRQALIVRKLSSIYGTVGVDMAGVADVARFAPNGDQAQMEIAVATKIALDPLFAANFTIYNDINSFAALAVRIVELHADGLERWINPAVDGAAQIDAAFQHYLANADLWQAIETQRIAMDRPNGVEGAAPDQLTPEEHSDPLSVAAGPNGANGNWPTRSSKPGVSAKRAK